MSRQDEMNKLIRAHNRRLQILKEQKAIQGSSVDPKIIIEIEDIETELRKLTAEFKEIEDGVALLPQINTPTSSSVHGKSQRADQLSAYVEPQRVPEKSAEQEYQMLWQIQMPFKPQHLFASPDYVCLVTNNTLHFLSPTNGTPLLPPLTAIGNFSLTDYALTGGAVTPSGNLLLTLLPSHSPDKACLLALKLTRISTAQPANVSVQWVYEAPGSQLSSPIIDNQTAYLIQGGPELVALYLERGQVKRVIPLPNSYNLHQDCVSFAFAASYLCLALCDGTILALDSETGQIVTTLYEHPEGEQLSPLTTDGLRLFFGLSPDQKSASPSHVCALDVISGQEVWKFPLPPSPSGKHRPIEGRPLVVNKSFYVTGRNHYLHALEVDTGQEQWHYEMPSRIKLGPVWTGTAVVVADQQGNVHALTVTEPAFVVTCHYDLKTLPVLNEWNPLIFTLINTSNRTAQYVALRLSGDFEGRSEHHTQQLYTIRPGEFKRPSVYLKPTAAGATVHLAVTVDYQYGNGPTRREKFDLFIPVRRSNLDAFVERETGISSNGDCQYNYLALRALLMAALTDSTLTRICSEHFRPVHNKFIDGMSKREKISRLIEYINQHRQVEKLLMVLKQHNPTRYEQYIPEIKLPVLRSNKPQTPSSATEFDVFLAHNSRDKSQVEAIAGELKQRGLRPWLDKEQIPPGRWFQDIIQQTITQVKSAAIFIGPSGLGKWQALELRSFISQCVETDLPVIPVLLPGVNNIPEKLLFLKELNWVRFTHKVDDAEALDNLEWGITGKRPQRNL